jgi:hypothetical protein
MEIGKLKVGTIQIWQQRREAVRDHWPECYSALIAGAGIQPGRVYGEPDRFGAYPNQITRARWRRW